MKIKSSCVLAFVLAASLSACNPGATVVTDTGNVIKANGKSVTLRAEGHPSAKISATGDLEIDGKPVPVNASQRALLQAYHREMNAMTADGIAIGKQGAALAGKAVSEAIKGAVSGKTDDIDRKVEAEAKKIEQQALQLCGRLAKVMASQDALAASLPEFKPYATMDQSDVDDCGSDQGKSYSAGKEAGGALAEAMKGGEQEHAGMDAAEEAEAASVGTAEAATVENADGR